MLETLMLASAGGGALFTLTELDMSPLIETVKANAPLIIGAGIGIIVVKQAVPLLPQMVKRMIKM